MRASDETKSLADWVAKNLADRVERTMEATSKAFERFPGDPTGLMWRHVGISGMVLCVEHDGGMDVLEENSDLHDVLLVGAASSPDDLYPFDDVCSCWAARWDGDQETKRLPQLIDQCARASVAYVVQSDDHQEDADPPVPVLSLTESLQLVDKYARELDDLFSIHMIDDTRTRLRRRRDQVYQMIVSVADE